MFNFLFATSAMIAVLYGVYWYIKKNPQLSGLPRVAKQTNTDRQIFIESTLSLEQRKRLYVVGYGRHRYLVASNVDNTEMLATLDTEAPTRTELIAEHEADIAAAIERGEIKAPLQLTGDTTFFQRFVMSLKMLIEERFSQTGGGR
jgi:flagellar biogenesis protein FliO